MGRGLNCSARSFSYGLGDSGFERIYAAVGLWNRSDGTSVGASGQVLPWTCPHFWHKKLRLKIHRMENLSHGVIAPEVHERV